MGTSVRTLLKLVLLSILSIGVAACHSSKKTVKGSSGVPVRKVDYGEMKSDVRSRHYNIPQIGALVEEASRWLGVPYKYAGNDKKGVDCSGLTSQVFLKTLNVKMPRSSREQQQWCINVRKENLQPGDLVFFATGSDRKRVSHVGIYIGNGDIIHASSTRGVIVSNLGESYYLKRYHSSGRPDVVHQLYATAGKKKNKDNKKDKQSKLAAQPADDKEMVPTVTVPSISVDELIEMQVDSIASAINDTPPAVHTPAINRTPQAPVITTEEPSDTVFTQFFD